MNDHQSKLVGRDTSVEVSAEEVLPRRLEGGIKDFSRQPVEEKPKIKPHLISENHSYVKYIYKLSINFVST